MGREWERVKKKKICVWDNSTEGGGFALGLLAETVQCTMRSGQQSVHLVTPNLRARTIMYSAHTMLQRSRSARTIHDRSDFSPCTYKHTYIFFKRIILTQEPQNHRNSSKSSIPKFSPLQSFLFEIAKGSRSYTGTKRSAGSVRKLSAPLTRTNGATDPRRQNRWGRRD